MPQEQAGDLGGALPPSRRVQREGLGSRDLPPGQSPGRCQSLGHRSPHSLGGPTKGQPLLSCQGPGPCSPGATLSGSQDGETAAQMQQQGLRAPHRQPRQWDTPEALPHMARPPTPPTPPPTPRQPPLGAHPAQPAGASHRVTSSVPILKTFKGPTVPGALAGGQAHPDTQSLTPGVHWPLAASPGTSESHCQQVCSRPGRQQRPSRGRAVLEGSKLTRCYRGPVTLPGVTGSKGHS